MAFNVSAKATGKYIIEIFNSENRQPFQALAENRTEQSRERKRDNSD